MDGRIAADHQRLEIEGGQQWRNGDERRRTEAGLGDRSDRTWSLVVRRWAQSLVRQMVLVVSR
jgi:hypothetical protein